MEKTLKAVLEYDNTVRQEQVIKKQKEYHLVGQTRNTTGHTLFEFNTKTQELKPADVTRSVVYGVFGKFGGGRNKFETRVDVHQDCIYVQALNKKNAIKQLRKSGIL